MPSININELMRSIIHIRNNIDKVEVKGYDNQTLLVQAYAECENILNQLGTVLEEIQKQHNKKEEAKPDDSDKNT